MAPGDPFLPPDPFGRSQPSKELTEGLGVAGASSTGARVYVKLDMEGITGIVDEEQLEPGTRQYDLARRMLMADLGAVLEGAFAAGCSDALVYDAHATGRNVDLGLLDRRASVIVGRPEPTNDFVYGLDDSFEAMFLVVFHARAGAPGALFPHTCDGDIAAVRINGAVVGEIGLEAALAGEFGVPVALVSSDAAGVRETRELLGADVATVEVKRAITPTSGICLSVAETAALLREAAVEALQRAPSMPLMVFPSPVTLDVEFASAESAAALESLLGIERTDERMIRASAPTVVDAYRQFLDARGGRAARRTELRPHAAPRASAGRLGNPPG